MHKINYIKQPGQYIGRGESLFFDKKRSICEFFEKQVKLDPTKIAMRYNNALTFEQLNSKASQLAHYLSGCGLSPKNSVAVYLEPGFSTIIAILAILKTGCCYVPLDVNYPADRIDFMLKDSCAELLITDSHLFNASIHSESKVIKLDEILSQLDHLPSQYDCLACGEDLAYIIYTSGSTGVPKGVKISHRAVNNHMLWMMHQFKFDNTEKILQKTPLSFDPSVWEIFLPLYVGSEMIISPSGSHIDPEALIDLVVEHKITIIQLVPSILKLFLNNKRIHECNTLRYIFVGGESLRPEIKRLFFETLSCNLVNLYGPTEATIDITSHRVMAEDIETNIIGTPISNTSLYVINANNNLALIGEDGELCIGSDSLSNGYHHREMLTQDHFVDNPFEPDKYAKIYKTGDLVRWLPSGELEYLGRNNEQIKINGVRIEPKELVLSILQHKDISDCIVVKKIDSHGHDYLACYLTHEAHIKIDINAIKNSLKEKFPSYMLPRVYVSIDRIPLTVNGKVDMSALPEPDFKISSIFDNENEILDKDERELLLLWQIVLETNQISSNDNFFDVGGGSLLALKLITMIQEKFHVSIRLRDIFSSPTVKEQLTLIKSIRSLSDSPKKNNVNIPSPMICLQSLGEKTPLFLIHPIGGTVFWFSHLAKLLGTSRPIYGIQDPSIDLEKPVLDSIEDMAKFYLQHIKKIQNDGPYLIGGASFGATVAAEISNQLKNTNEKVSSIIMLDGWGVYPNTLLDDNYFRSSMLRQHAELISDFKKYGLPPPEILFDIQWFRLNLLWKYQLGLIECPIVLFKSEEILPAFIEIDSPHNHWEDFSNNQIETIIVPGNHETMFQEPHVYQLSEYINQYLKKVGL